MATKENTSFKKFLLDSFGEINPMNNFKGVFSNFKQDLSAGLTVAVIALPLALAFGVGSGLGASAGLWAAIIGGIIGGLFGGSLIGISGPTGPLMVQVSILIAAANLLPEGTNQMQFVFGTIFLSGLFLSILSFFRIARLVYYTPYSVVAGFMCGVGLIVIFLQIPTFLGLPPAKSAKDVLMNLPHLFQNIHQQTFIISMATLVTLFVWSFLVKKIKRLNILPAPIVGLVVGTILAQKLGYDVTVIGDIPTGIPELQFPKFSNFQIMFGPAMTLAGLTLIDSLLTCLVGDHLNGQHHSSDREAFGRGLSNMICGLFGAMPNATSTTGTVANYQNGARTVMASIIHGLILLTLVLGLGPVAAKIPMACLAAILLKVGFDIIDYRIVPILHKLPFTDAWSFWGVMGITVWVDLLVAMAVGMAFAAFRFVHEMGHLFHYQSLSYNDFCHNDKDRIKKDISDKIVVLRPRGPLFFGSVEPLIRSYTAFPKHKYLLIDLHKVTHIDLSGSYVLEDIILKARSNNVQILFGGATEKVHSWLENFKIIENMGLDCYYKTYDEAIARIHNLENVKIYTRLRSKLSSNSK